MLRWPNNQGVMGDDPPYLVVGTEVSAKYKGAFCEAKVRKVVRSVKCKVNFKLGLGTAVVTDDQIRGTLRVGSVVEVKHPDRKEYVEACIAKIQDCSQYTVVFDDGDITTLRRTALCLKSGRHFAESETLDQLPLTHPEHFGNPVVGSRRGGRRSRNPMSDESSEDEEEPRKGKSKEEKEADMGKVVCVELGDKKKQKDNWFPGLVVAPTAQEVVRIRVKDEYLVRSFKDGRYFTVPKKEATEFTREIGLKVDNNTLKTAVDKALLYLDKDELPPHWDREVLFGLDDASTASDSDAAFESDSSDDEPREEKDHFVAQLYKFMDDRGTPINRGPAISGRDIDLYKLFKVVHKLGGYNRVTNHNQWKMVSHKLGFGQFSNTANLVKVAYKKYLHSFEDFYRKLGCTMVNHPRGNRIRHRGGRSLIRDKDRATPVNVPRGDSKDKASDTVDDDDDDDDDQQEKEEDSTETSMDDKDEEPAQRDGKNKEKEDLSLDFKRSNDKSVMDIHEKDERPQRISRELKRDDRPPKRDEKFSTLVTARDSDVVTKLPLGPPPMERKPSDPQLKVSTPKGKPKRLNDGSVTKSGSDINKRRIVVTKVKGSKVIEDEDDEMEELDVEDIDDEDEDKLTTTRSKSKEEFSRSKSDVKSISLDLDKKAKLADSSERKVKPSLTATAEKRMGRPSLANLSDKKTKALQESDRKTVRSLAAEFEKKSRVLEVDKKEPSSSETDKKSRSYSVNDSEKKIRPSLTATLERKKPSASDSDKKSRQGGIDSDKKIRPSLTAEPERKKVRPSLTADPMKKLSRVDSDRKKESDKKNLRPSDIDKDDVERKSKPHDLERKVNTPDSAKLSSVGDSDRKSSKSDSGDSDKRGSSKSRKIDEDKRKLQVRKRKDIDENGGSSVDDSLDQLPSYKNVCVGDKLKVYYGPTHESKVTYEAKVLEVEGEGQEEAYLVHYTGWNNRYDEWIKRSRIADNVSWSPARGKRRHQTQLPGAKKSSVKRRTLTPARDGASSLQKDQAQSMPSLPGLEKSRDSNPPRSSTPSSVTSSSSRTKSPAMRPSSARVTRNTIGDVSQQLVEQITRRTRTRRISGQTDVASESESEGSGSESEAEPSIIRKSSRRLASERDDDLSKKESTVRKKQRKREIDVEADEDIDKEGDKEDLKDDVKDEDDVSSESPSEDKLPMKRTRKGTRVLAERKTEIKIEVEEEETPSQTSKGRDFDLNQIRSELKGIDKTVKASSSPGSERETKKDSESEPEPDAYSIDLPDEKPCTLLEPEESTIDMEDVYEFKEPEPFEFEVRSKREPSVERAGKLQKRPLPRIFDDLEKMEPIIKKKAVKPSLGDSESSEEGSPSKKRFRRSTGKKEELEVTLEAQSIPLESGSEKILVPEQLTPQKKIFSSPNDDAFDKLRQSPSYRFSAGSPIRATTPTPSSSSVPVPMQSPPQPSISSASVITSILPLNKPSISSSSNVIHSSTITKAVPVTQPKQGNSAQPLKIIPAPTNPSVKHSSQETKAQGGIKLAQSSSAQVMNVTPSASRPPVLAAAVKVPAETGVITKTEDWLKRSQQIPDKSDLVKEEESVKNEKDDSLPPLVPTALSVPVADRTSPEPPQLLPMFGPTPKVMQEPTKSESREVQMPQIKKESLVDIEAVNLNSPRVSQPAKIPVRPKTPVIEEQQDESVEEDSPRKACRRKTQIKRKKAVSKEFVEDSDTDSSDEGRRLVIDKSESSDSCSETADSKLSPAVKDHETKWRPVAKSEDSCLDQQTSSAFKEDEIIPSKAKDLPSVSTIIVDTPVEETVSTVKVEDPEEPEVDGNLCSLLCEETIPGSPAPPGDTPADVHSESSSSRTSERPLESSNSTCKILEMPFASVPGNARSSGPSTPSNAGAVQFPKVISHGEKAESTVPDSVQPKAGPSAVANEAAPVMDNTPPTTPDSTISTLSNSPRGEHGDSLSILDNDSSKSHRDSEDNKDNNDFSDDDLDVGSRMKRMSALPEKDSERDKGRCDVDSTTLSPASKKRRRSRKGSESEDRSKRPRHASSRVSGRGAGSDSDDNTENATPIIPSTPSHLQSPTQAPGTQHTSISLPMTNSQSPARSPRPSKYNFFVDLAPELDASQRIALLQQTLQELRKTYANVKQQLACIDRRRKKLRRREREARLEARKMMREERKQARVELVSCS